TTTGTDTWVTISLPVSTGLHTVTLISVSDENCVTDVGESIDYAVGQNAEATIAVAVDGCGYQVEFIGSNADAPYTFEYTIDGGAVQTVSTDATSDSVLVEIPAGTAAGAVLDLISVS